MFSLGRKVDFGQMNHREIGGRGADVIECLLEHRARIRTPAVALDAGFVLGKVREFSLAREQPAAQVRARTLGIDGR